MAAMEHVKEIRRINFSIGVEPTPVNVDHLLQPVEYLSAEPYMKDVHVLMELIQIAEDKEYPEGVDPCLEFVITSKDITNTGAPATLLVFNNDEGFSKRSIDLLCTGPGYVGEKGNGFKSVFHITPQPYIFSNDYQIMFNEKPCQHCNVSYIVPEWVENGPTLSDIKNIYGSVAPLPTTTLVLPIKQDKVKLVKDQLSRIHPEFLLFHEKLKRLSVREDNVSPISISRENDFLTSKSMPAVSYIVYITADDTVYNYYMWKQTFPMMQKNEIITLAFPIGQRPKKGAVFPPGIYSSFLPTDTVTNFPFIIQADFLLDSSRKNILWDNKLNHEILNCVPDTFINAFTTLMTSTPNAPISSLQNMFRFLPLQKSSHPKLDDIRDAIRSKVKNESVFPCESYTGKKLFCKPVKVRWVNPAFWSIMNSARSQGLRFPDISSYGAYVIAPSFDTKEYNEFLEIPPLGCEWYAKCIKRSKLVTGVSEDVYIQLLVFIAQNWESWSDKTSIKNTRLIKCFWRDGKDHVVNLVSDTLDKLKLLMTDCDSDSDCISWLINWNQEFRCLEGRVFLPKVTQVAIRSCLKKPMLVTWLKDVAGVKFVSVYKYAESLGISVKWYPSLVVTYARFLYTSFANDYLSKSKVEDLCCKMPFLDNYGQVPIKRGAALLPSSSRHCINRYNENVRNSTSNMRFYEKHKQVATSGYVRYIRRNDNIAGDREGVITKGEILIPADGSRWVELLGTDPRTLGNYAVLGKAYTLQSSYFGGVISGEELIKFLETYAGAFDVPHVPPPNSPIPTVSAPLTKINTFLLLDWIRNMNTSDVSLPERFLSSIKYNSWLKVSWRSSPDYCPPSESFMLESSITDFLKNNSPPFDTPFVDEKFYGEKIKTYKKELETIGVRTQHTEACEYIGKRLMSLAESFTLNSDHVFWILKFVEFLRKNHISPEKFIQRIGGDNWLTTFERIVNLEIKSPDKFRNYVRPRKWRRTRLHDYRSPTTNFFKLQADWELHNSSFFMPPFVDEIHDYLEELKELDLATDVFDGFMIPSRKRKRENEEKA